MGIHEHETVETPSPIRPRTPALWVPVTLVLVAIVAAAIGVVAFHPRRPGLLAFAGPRPIPVTITSTPGGADVFVDDTAAGQTPTSVKLLPGPHVVRILRRGYKPWRHEIDPAASAEVAPTLEPLELATLVIESQPDRAAVYLDDEHRGMTPLWLKNIEAGPHTVRVTKEPLYEPVIEHLELRKDEFRRLTLRLPSGLESLYLTRIKEDPKKLSNYTELLHLHVLQGETKKALDVLVQALDALKAAEGAPTELRQFHDELMAVYRGAAGALAAATRKQISDAVLTLFERIALSGPGETEYYHPLVSFLAQQAGRYDDIAKVCDKAVQQGKSRGSLHLQIAQLYLNLGDAKNAVPLLERAAKLHPGSYSVHFQLASAYHRLGSADDRAARYDDALREYRTAEKIAADNLASKKPAEGTTAVERGTLQTCLARVLVAKGDPVGAIACYREALKIETSPYYSCQWRLMFAQLLEERGRRSDAIEQYREIARLAPTAALGREAQRALQRLGAN